MKYLYQLRKAGLLLLSLFVLHSTNAQLCIPDPMYTSGGVHPDTSVSLVTGCVGSSYHQEFTIVVPADTVVFGFTFPINYMMVDSVGGLPPGILYLCNPGTCSYPGGTSGCFQLYGTPLASGIFNLTFYIHGQAIVFGTPTILNFAYTGYEIYVGAHPTLTMGNLPATCNASNGTAWVTASGSSGYTYSWNTAPISNNDTIFNLGAGIYQVTVTDLYNCASIDTAIVNDLGAPVIDTIMVINPLCYGGIDGSATVTASGGTLPYHYLWFTGDTTATLPNVGLGSYSIAVSDSNGCQVSSVANIGQPAQLLAFASHTDATCNGANDGTALATVIGGTGTYHYNWTSGDTTATTTSLSPILYSVTVTDNNGCTATASTTVSEPPAISINLVAVNASCFGGADGMVSAIASGGTPGFTYSWNNGDITNTTTGLAIGNYIVTVTDTVGCIAMDSATVASPTSIAISLVGTNESILGALDGTVNATISGGTPGYSYLWNNSATTQDISGLAGGTYILQVTDTNGCVNSDTISIQTIPGFGLDEANDIFKIYPNPAVGYFYLEMTETGTMALFDALGNQILSKNVNAGKQVVEISTIPKGIYMLAITVGNQRRVMKLMVE